MARSSFDKNHPRAVAARERAVTVIDQISPEELVGAIRRAPSLRGMIAGYIAEEMFEKHVLAGYKKFESVRKHDDHDRKKNKADRDFIFEGRRYSIQLKSVQTNSIKADINGTFLVADVQNDGSDMRQVKLPNEHTVTTTCYRRGEYDILAVPLFPFTGNWDFAYKRNLDCRACESPKYKPQDQKFLLATTEKIIWPLADDWTVDLLSLLDEAIGAPVDSTT